MERLKIQGEKQALEVQTRACPGGQSEPRTDARADGSGWLDSGAVKPFSILLVSL